MKPARIELDVLVIKRCATNVWFVYDDVSHLNKGHYYKKPILSGHSKRRPKIVFKVQLSLNEGQTYCKMPQWEYSAIFLTYVKLPLIMKIFVFF